MKLLVSIHDVSPAWTPAVVTLWQLCKSFDVAPALFVVPNWHGAWPLEKHPAFVRWLQQCATNGAEVFLHGERHDELGSQRSMVDELRAFGRTNGEGEFLTLNQSQAGARIDRGLDLLRTLGLSPIGFVPPAWLAREHTYRAALDAGLEVAEDASAVRLLRRGKQLRAPAVRWSGRTPTRARASALVARARWHTQRNLPLVRLALHPQDLEHPATTESLFEEVRRWLNLRATGRYAEL